MRGGGRGEKLEQEDYWGCGGGGAKQRREGGFETVKIPECVGGVRGGVLLAGGVGVVQHLPETGRDITVCVVGGDVGAESGLPGHDVLLGYRHNRARAGDAVYRKHGDSSKMHAPEPAC